jgi:RNA polymerase sigma-70 factor (ECF subfamily)
MSEMTVDKDTGFMLAFKAGDENAFKILLDKFSSPILNFAYRFISNRNDAEDIAQEVFVKVYKSKDRYEPVSKFSSWLYAVAANTCLDYKKRKKKDILYHSMPVELHDDDNKQLDIADTSGKSVESTVEQSRIDDTVKKALNLLAENQRLTLILKEYEDKSYEEIADILDISISSVESLIFRARQNLKKQLADIAG